MSKVRVLFSLLYIFDKTYGAGPMGGERKYTYLSPPDYEAPRMVKNLFVCLLQVSKSTR